MLVITGIPVCCYKEGWAEGDHATHQPTNLLGSRYVGKHWDPGLLLRSVEQRETPPHTYQQTYWDPILLVITGFPFVGQEG